MAKNLRDRGYGSSMDNYKQQQKKKQEEKHHTRNKTVSTGTASLNLNLPKVEAPVSTQRMGTVNNRASSALSERHSRQKNVSPGTAAVSAKPIVKAPVSTQRFGMGDQTHVSQYDFNKSDALKGLYATYDNYINDTPVTGGGYYSPPEMADPNVIQSQQQRQGALLATMEKYAPTVEQAGKNYEKAFAGETAFNLQYVKLQQAEENLKFMENQLDSGKITQAEYDEAYNRYIADYARAKSMYDAEDRNYAKKAEKAAAEAKYIKAVDAFNKMVTDYYRYGAELGTTMTGDQQKYDEWYSKIRPVEQIQPEINSLKSRRDEVYEKLTGYENLQRQMTADLTHGTAQGQATAQMLQGTMNLSDEIERLRKEYDVLTQRIDLAEEEKSYSRYFYWKNLAEADVRGRRVDKPKNALLDKVITGDASTEEQVQAAQDFNFNSGNAAVMTDAERQRYEQIKAKHGGAAAMEYYRELEQTSLNTRRRMEEEQWVRDVMDSSPDAWAGMNMLSVLLKPLELFSFAGQTADYIFSGGMEKDASYNAFSYLNSAVRNKSTEDMQKTWGKWGAFGYQTGMSMLDFLYNAEISGSFGLGGAEPTKAAENIGLLLMSSEAAADTTIQALDRGLDAPKAYWLGVIGGAAEYITERVSLETLLDKIPAGKGWKGYVQYLAKNIVAEGSEEGASDLINLVADILITKDQSEWAQAVKRYERQGMTSEEAFRQALIDQAEQTGMSMLGGALSGGTMAVGSMAMNFNKNVQALTERGNVDKLIQRGTQMDENSKAYKAAADLQSKLEENGKVGAVDVLRTNHAIETESRTGKKAVDNLIETGRSLNGEAAKAAEELNSKREAGQRITAKDVAKVEDAIFEATETTEEALRPYLDVANNSDQKSVAYKSAARIEEKLAAGEKITAKEARTLQQSALEAQLSDLTSGNDEAIGRRVSTAENRENLLEAVDMVLSEGTAEMQKKAAALQAQIKYGIIDNKTAGAVFKAYANITENQETSQRELTPREVTADMDAFDRSAAEIGVSEKDAARDKAIMKVFGIEGEYKVLDNDQVNAYYDTETGKIVLNAKAQNVGLSIIAHEVTHSIEGTASYAKLADMIVKSKGAAKNAILNQIRNKYEGAGINLKEGEDVSEMVAEFVEKHMFTDEAAINDIAKKDRTIIEKLRDAADALLAKMGNEQAQERQFLKQARQLYAKALGERDKSKATKAKLAEKTGPKNLELAKVDNGVKNSITTFALTAGFELTRDANNKLVFTINGKPVTEVKAKHIENSAFGALIKVARDGIKNKGIKGHISPAQAQEQFEAVAKIMQAIINAQNPEMVWELAGSQLFAAVKANADGQYGTTVDFSTVCLKTTNIINALSERMMALGRGLTKAEVTQLQKELADEGLVVPCPVCYVFSRWAGAGSLLDNMKKFQQKYNGKTDAEIEAAIEQLRARDEKAVQADIRRKLREGKAQENQDAYTQLMGDVEKANDNIAALRSQVKTAKKNGRAADVEALEDAINANQAWKKKSQSQMEKLERELDVGAQELAWLEQVRTKPRYQPVPDNILFNMASAEAIEEFMTNPHYAMSYRYRTTRGSAMGKAIEPYADMRLGDFILPIGKKSADGNTLFSSPLDVDGEFNDDQKDAIIEAIARVRAQNLIGGQRFQSTSDFRYEYALDYIQAFFEAQALGSNMQTYTKVIEFGEMVARIGGDVNLSVMPRNKGFKVDGAMPQNPKGESVLSYNDGDYTGGYLIYSNKTGIDFGAAKLLKDRYGNAQMILVGINDDHIRLALNDQFDEVDGKKVSYTGGYHVGFVIPYHTSGAAIDTFIRDLVSNLGETFLRENYQDYTDVGSDKVKSTSTKAQTRRRNLRKQLLTGHAGLKNWSPSSADISWMRNFAKRQKSMNDIRSMSFEEMYRIEQNALLGDPAAIREYESWSAGMLYDIYKKMWKPSGAEYGVRLNGEQSKTIMPHEYWDTNGTRDKAYVNNFLFRSYCYNLGMTPRFTGINSSGKVTDHGDFSDCKGYWKTLIDRSMYGLDGKYRAQQSINMSELEVGMVHPNWSKENWSEYSAKQPEIERAKEIGRRVEGKQFSISKSDTAYLKAVESGDMETAQRMVDEAAASAMPNSVVRDKDGNLLRMHHGTDADFTVFDRDRIGQRGRFEGSGFNFTPYDGRARGYGKNVLGGYLNIESPLSATKKTISITKLADIIRNIDPTGDNIIANYARDTNDYGSKSFVEREARTTARAIWKWANNDVDIYSELSAVSPDSDSLIEYFSNAGYDGVIHYDEDGRIRTAVAFDSNQFKLTDPVTYDDSGKPIPLSERFNPENKDIRYAVNKDATIRDDQELRDRVREIQDQLDMAEMNGLPDAEIRRLNGQLYKAQAQFDQFTARQRGLAKKTSINDIISNIDRYDRMDLESLAEQISDSAWDDYEDLGDDELREAIVDALNRRVEDMEPGDADKARFGFAVKAPNSPIPLSLPVAQEISSAKTSLKQVPALFTDSRVKFGKVNVDIGGGRFDLATNYLKERGTQNLLFDPYNRDRKTNRSTLQYLQNGNRADTATCANVLNVIAEPEARANVILEAAKSIKDDGTAYFMVYEGDGSGNGKRTSAGWQNNMKTADYVSEIEQYFDSVERKGKLIIASDPKADLPQASWEVQPGEAIRYAINKDATIRTEGELIDSIIDPKETAKAGVENALDDYLDSIGAGSDIPGMDKISTGTKRNAKLPAKYKAQDAARFFYRKMVDSGEAVTRLGRYSNDPHLYHYYNMARASSNAAVSMIQDAQTDVMGRRVGDSLNDIFSAIRKKGDQYYADLQAYLFHTHNIDRMSRANPGAIASAQAELEQFRHDNPELANMADFQIERLANDPISFYHDQARAYMQILRRLQQAAATHNKPVFGQDVTAEQSRRAAEDLREKLSETEGFEEDVEKIYAYIDNLMQYRIDSGLITEEEYQRLKEIYPHYVPTFREQEPAARNKRGNTTEIGKTVGRAQGGDTRLIPLHRALAQQTFSVVREGSKNRFGQMLLEGKQNNSRGMIKNVEEAEGGFHEDTFDEEDVTPKKENTFIVRQGGKRYEIGMDNALYEAVTALSPEPAESNFLINFVHKSNDLFKALCTGYNPTFLVRNFMRDLQDAGLYSKDLSEFSKNYPLAYKEITTNGKYWQMYKALGGLYSSFFDYQTGELKQPGKVKKYTVDAIESVNMAVEQAPRLAEFMATVKKAEKAGNLSMDTLMEAIYNAADVTVNFGRSGKWGKMFNRSVVPFFNPGVQGFDKMIRNVTETKGFKDWARLAAKATILGIAPAVISRLLFGKRKDWDEIKQRDKDIYYLFPLQDGVWLKLPKGRVLSVFGMAADRAMQGKDADWASFIETSLTQTAPENPLTASYWRPWLDAKLFDKDDPGKTWYGSDIENQRLRNLAPGQRYDTTTDALSKWLGKTFNLSPKKINYLLDQYSGVIGDVLLPLTSDRAEKGLFTNAFTIDSVVSNQLSEDFYDMKDRLTWAKNDPNATGEDEALYKYWNEQTSAISDINKAIRAIEQDKSLTDKEKRDLTRVQYSLRNGIMRNALDSMSDYRAGGTDNDIYSKVSDAQAQEERESKTYNFKGQDVAWDDLSGTQKKIVQAQDAIDNDPNADLSEIIGKGNATKKLAQYQAARDQGISNQTYIDALQAIDDADDGNGNYNQAEAKAGLDKLISDGTISEKEAGTLWKIITGGADKNNPFPVGAIGPIGLRLPKIG